MEQPKHIPLEIVTPIDFPTHIDLRQGNFSLIPRVKDESQESSEYIAVVRSCNFFTTDRSYFRNYKTDADYRCTAYLVDLSPSFEVNKTSVRQVFSQDIESKFYIEDVRLFYRRRNDSLHWEIWGSASIRPIKTSIFTMGLFCLEEPINQGKLVDEIYLIEGPHLTNKVHLYKSGGNNTFPVSGKSVWEKGWMPFYHCNDDRISLIYNVSPLIIARVDLKNLRVEYPIAKGPIMNYDPKIRGSSQLIQYYPNSDKLSPDHNANDEFPELTVFDRFSMNVEVKPSELTRINRPPRGWYMGIIHESKWLTKTTRAYYHSLVIISPNYETVRIGPSFKLINPVVEFINGIHFNENEPDSLYVCLGVNDETSYLVKLDLSKICPAILI